MTVNKQSVSAPDTEIIRQFYASINRNDVDAAMELLAPDIYRNEFEGFPGAGTYRGHAELRQNFVSGRSTWAEGACEPVDFFAAGNKIVVAVHVKVRLKDHTTWIDDRIADGFIIANGLIKEFHSFPNNQKAFEWAGIVTGG